MTVGPYSSVSPIEDKTERQTLFYTTEVMEAVAEHPYRTQLPGCI
jgi:hypothetical protein